MPQTLLFPDPKPLVERFGHEFFRALPEVPGVYLMRGADDTVLYVGKAKNLRKRLGSYRVANPERMPRRHLRMLRAVVRIELEPCADEALALARESELLQLLKPRFNRAGTWRPPPQFLAWRVDAGRLELTVTETPGSGWGRHGPLGSSTLVLRALLARLLWWMAHPDAGYCCLPVGWVRGEVGERVLIDCGGRWREIMVAFEGIFQGEVEGFRTLGLSRLSVHASVFERGAVAADLEALAEFRFIGAGISDVSRDPGCIV
jgi:predicted GIY-YIG superfamily endonuclease